MLIHDLGDGVSMERVETRHADAFFAVITSHRARLGRWEAWPWAIQSPADCRTWIGRLRDDDARDEGVSFGLWLGPELVGMAALADINARHLSATYWGFVCPGVEGHGAADRATRATLHYAFRELGLERVNWFCAIANHASRGLAARLGFHYNGLLPSYQVIQDTFVDFVLYSMRAGEWEQAERRSEQAPVRPARPSDRLWIERLAGRPLELPAWVIAERGVLQTRWTARGVVEIQACAVARGAERHAIAAWLLQVVENRLRQQGAGLLTIRSEGARREKAFLLNVARKHGFQPLQPGLWAKGL